MKEGEIPIYPFLVLFYFPSGCFFSPANFWHSNSVSNGKTYMSVFQLKNRSEAIEIISRLLTVSVHSKRKRRNKEIRRERKMELLIRQFSCGSVKDSES